MQPTSKQLLNIRMIGILIPFLSGINIDLYAPSLPAITNYFHSPIYLAQLTVSAYILAYGVTQLFFGALTDCIGRRKILIFCLAAYTLASFAASTAYNIYYLIGLRFLQGACLAGGSVIIRAINVDIFTGTELKKAVNNINASWALGPIIGPFIGGYLQQLFNWQADFYFFGIYSLLALICTIKALPETLHPELKTHPKHITNILKTIFAHRVFILASIIVMLIYTNILVFNIIAPFYLQNILHYSPVFYGNIALLMGLSYFIGSFGNRILLNHFQAHRMVKIAFIFAIILSSLILTFAIILPHHIFYFVIPIAGLFICCGILLPNIAAEYARVFTKGAGIANAIAGMFICAGAALISIATSTTKPTTAIPLGIIYFTVITISFILTNLMYNLQKMKDK